MLNKKLNINLSPIQTNPDNKFIIRFNDISEQTKNVFVDTIKLEATIQTIRSKIPITTIYSILEEINPILFAESKTQSGYKHNFSSYLIRKLNKKTFHSLCKIIYWLSTNKHLNRTQLNTIIYSTNFLNNNYEIIRETINNYLTPPTQDKPLDHSEVNISTITQTREKAETRNR